MDIPRYREMIDTVLEAPRAFAERVLGYIAATNAVLKLDTGFDHTSPFTPRERQHLNDAGVLPPPTPPDTIDQ